jgi:hypothetical protein
MTATEPFWSWAIVAAIVLAVVGIGIFALVYVPLSLWRNRRRK